MDYHDYHALQRRLFEIDPADPAEDIRKLTEMATGEASVGSENLTVNHLEASVADIPEGSVPLDKDYSVSDFAKLAGVQINEAPERDSMMKSLAKKVVGDDGVAAFKAGSKNYNNIKGAKAGADAALDTVKSNDPKAKIPTAKADKDSEYSALLSQHSRKLQKIAANPKRKAQFDKFMSSISEEELDEVLPALAGIAGRAVAGAVANKAVDALTANKNPKKKPIKARDPNAQYMNDLRKSGAAGSHKDKTKTIPRKQKHKDTNESIKSQLWAALNSKK